MKRLRRLSTIPLAVAGLYVLLRALFCRREHLPNGFVNARRGFRVDGIIVARTRMNNDCFVARVRLQNHPLKPVAHNLVVIGQQEDRRGMNSSRVGDTVQFVRNLPRDRNRQQPEIPPSVCSDDELPQRRWVLNEQSSNREELLLRSMVGFSLHLWPKDEPVWNSSECHNPKIAHEQKSQNKSPTTMGRVFKRHLLGYDTDA